MNTKFLLLILFCCYGASCSDNSKIKNLEYVKTIKKGDNQRDVIEKMHGMPNEIIIPDSLYLFNKEEKELTTFIYKLPRFASSDIYIYFKDCDVIYVYHDNHEWRE